MANVQYESLAITATSSGSVATPSSNTYSGLVQLVRYVANASTSGVIGNAASTIAVTAERSGLTVISIATPATSASWYPVATTVDTAGAASTGARAIPLYNERLIVTLTSGSTDATTKTGTIHLYVT